LKENELLEDKEHEVIPKVQYTTNDEVEIQKPHPTGKPSHSPFESTAKLSLEDKLVVSVDREYWEQTEERFHSMLEIERKLRQEIAELKERIAFLISDIDLYEAKMKRMSKFNLLSIIFIGLGCTMAGGQPPSSIPISYLIWVLVGIALIIIGVIFFVIEYQSNPIKNRHSTSP